MRRRAGLFLLTLFVLSAGPTQAQAKRSTLRLAKLSGVPKSVTPGQAFTVRSRVGVRRRRARRVIVTATLRSGGTVGRRVLKRLKPGTRRRLRLKIQIPARGVGAGDNRLQVCARSKRSKRRRCVTKAFTVLVNYGVESPANPVATAPAGPTATATAGPAATATVTATPTATPTPEPGVGAETVGDVLFPNLGNGGYDAQGYDLALSYSPFGAVRTLAGTATMTAKATQELTRFSLDLQGFTVSKVTVDGQDAAFARFDSGTDPLAAHKLRITPATPIASGATFTVVTTYTGAPPEIVDPDGSKEGFAATSDGAWVVGEPMGAMGWFPNDNHPSDKATFRLAMTVPPLLDVVGNGVLEADTGKLGTSRTMTWNETHPMATYLATATIGNFTITKSTVDGLPYYDAAESVPGTGVADEPDVLALYQAKYGDYPFAITGSIVDPPPDLMTYGYALETQTKPIYPSALFADPSTVSHELAHQYYGDSVSITQWQEIWLNEGFAEFSSWLYGSNSCGATPKACFDGFYAEDASSDFWKIPPGAPQKAADIFDPDAEYNRGAMTLEALHESVGDTVFFDIMRTWATDHAYGNATIAQFIALVKAKATTKSPAAVQAFFQDWLYDADKPTIKTF